MAVENVFGLPFAEQEAYFRAKLRVPSERWDDIRLGAHDRVFMVAGAQKADLLADLQNAIGDARTRGGLDGFRAEFDKIVARHGWTGWTGEDTPAGRAWRTRTIYETNLYTSYAAGRWRQLKDAPGLRYWIYHHSPLVAHPRLQHAAWDGLVLPADHPFWQTHYPPNGWGCRCSVTGAESIEDARALGADPAKPLPSGWNRIDPDTGSAPGIGRGWAYVPGANAETDLRDLVADKLIRWPEAIGKALTRDVNRWIDARVQADDFAKEALRQRQTTKDLCLGFIENPAVAEQVGRDLSGYLMLLPADSVRHAIDAHEGDGAGQRALTYEDFADASRWIAQGEVSSGQTVRGMQRVVVRYRRAGETVVSVWEVRPGKRNRALSFVSGWVKTSKQAHR